MIAAKVIDNIWATRKADSLVGLKFMLVEILGGLDAGRLIIAADTISAGIGDRVLVSLGSSARKMMDREDVPIDAAIVGIIDEDCTF
ncbi:EutN/CcmL family microcompartment protein [Desulfosporosinus youngiae]|uniref:Carbon dioxide concentrating mechanism/carboxysome shell protein n=1 Tax=Desulfosporosinus youngiae DSM 17734 TaxID=768710 RepID=H5Y078_9FIRM|nr:EutN/CcmL family microcompartment protein [Desulfosporosinus youngiae]EHQ92057.1 carbon dioxide concentrating mechanism/carboxysome shell protein [Desulfosporosinus youngiae DSM 17734]